MFKSKRFIFPALGVLLLGIVLFTQVDEKLIAATGNVYEQMKRFMEAFNAVKQYYVEDPDAEKLVTGAINGMLEQLDPHSVYIPPSELGKVTEQFDGYFFGIGIEFIIQNKILTVVSPIVGGPSEKLGMRPGDQIIEIEGKSAYGITEEEVQKKLRGPKDTQVTVTIRRPGMEEPLKLTITRDKIPINSVMAAFMVDDSTGYIYLGRFAKTTADELEKALGKLEAQGMKRLLLDLRLNLGGLLDQAVAVSNKFIDGGKKIVYTRGRIPNSNEDFYASDKATHPNYPLIVLIDHGSASASEIVAGAVQDWDRGLVVGETSFGKGLVQTQVPLKDGSAIRVTIAHYYTPSGRLIQRPFNEGLAEYYAEAYDETDPNAIPDSTAAKSVFLTSAGRKVYGNGGITPDVKIKSDRVTKFTSQLLFKRLFFEYGSDYAAKHKQMAANFEWFRTNFTVNEAMLSEFRKLFEAKWIEFKPSEYNQDLLYIKVLIKSEIARSLWDSEKYYQTRLAGDTQLQEALRLFPQAARLAALNVGG